MPLAAVGMMKDYMKIHVTLIFHVSSSLLISIVSWYAIAIHTDAGVCIGIHGEFKKILYIL